MSNNYDFQTLKALIGDEAENKDNYYRDPERILTIHSDIANGKKDRISIQLAKWIRQKKFGVDVRESIARFIEWISVLTNRITEESEQMAINNKEMRTEINDFTKDFNDRYNQQISGNTSLSEVIDARTDNNGEIHSTLKERLDMIENKTVNSFGQSMFDDVLGGIRPNFDKPISSMTSRLERLQNNVNIGQITDSHYTTRDSYWGADRLAMYSITHILNMGAVSEYLDFSVATGDNTDPYFNPQDIEKGKKYNRDFATVFHTALKCPTAILKGNHDDNSVIMEGKTGMGLEYIIKDDEFAVLYQQDGSNGEIRDGNSNYFYFDVKGIRIIGLDSFDTLEIEDENGSVKHPRLNHSAFSPRQVTWLYREALQTDLPVLIFTHCPLKGTFGGGTGISANHDAVRVLIESFKSGRSGFLSTSEEGYELELEYTFNQPHDVIACVYGHRHTDHIENINGINHIISRNSFSASGPTTDSNHISYLNTEDEDSWSVFSVDTNNKQVSWLKFGRGIDSTFNY